MSIRLPFSRKKEENIKKYPIHSKNNPSHVAIIMDGNGRWAKKRGFQRVAGHKEGMDATQRAVRAATKSNIKTLTLFAFSTENWKRPDYEVDFLMKLPKEYLHTYLPELIEQNVRIDTIGETDSLPNHTKEAIENAKEKTVKNDGLLLNFAINYGGRFDIVQAVKKIIQDERLARIDVNDINEEFFSSYLFTNNMPDPDLLIRTSGEKRLSNFLLWQCAYSEFWFTDTLWPDFTEEDFYEALHSFQNRKRRYGGIE